MKVVDVECQFDGNKITFFFTADHRVDFRSLVRDLASRFRTRIELRQIGVRDEARRNDGYGICGQRQCCNTFIREFAPISTCTCPRAGSVAESVEDLRQLRTSALLSCATKLTAISKSKSVSRRLARSSRPRHGSGLIQRIDYFQ